MYLGCQIRQLSMCLLQFDSFHLTVTSEGIWACVIFTILYFLLMQTISFFKLGKCQYYVNNFLSQKILKNALNFVGRCQNGEKRSRCIKTFGRHCKLKVMLLICLERKRSAQERGPAISEMCFFCTV